MMKELPMIIDTKLVEKLIDSDISAYQIEAETGVSRTTITNYRNGKAKIEKMHLGNAEKLYKLAKEKGLDKELS